MRRDIDFTGSDKEGTFALFLPVIRYKAALTITVFHCYVMIIIAKK